MEDKSAAIETVKREKASADPGSVGAPMSGVVVEVRVKEGQDVMKGDVLCVQSAMKVSLSRNTRLRFRTHLLFLQMESAVSAPVSGHVKRVLVKEGDSLNQGDLLIELSN